VSEGKTKKERVKMVDKRGKKESLRRKKEMKYQKQRRMYPENEGRTNK